MKKIISMISVFLLVFSLASCGENSEEAQETTVQTEEVTEKETETTAEVTTAQTQTTVKMQTEEIAADSETINYADNFYMEYDGDKCYLKYSDKYTKETVVDTFDYHDISSYDNDFPGNASEFIVKVDNIMGRSGVCVVGDFALVPFYFYYYTVVNDTPMLVASSFGVDEEIKNVFDYYGIDIEKNSDYDWMLDHYNVDIDNDGELEFIANCMYGGDGTMAVTVCKLIDGKPYTTKLIYENFFPDIDFPGGIRPAVLYSPNSNNIISKFSADIPGFDYDNSDSFYNYKYDKIYEYSIEDYDFDFEPLVKDN